MAGPIKAVKSAMLTHKIRQMPEATHSAPSTSVGNRDKGYASQGAAVAAKDKHESHESVMKNAGTAAAVAGGALLGGGALSIAGTLGGGAGVGVPAMVAGAATLHQAKGMFEDAAKDHKLANSTNLQRKGFENMVDRARGTDLGSRAGMKDAAQANDPGVSASTMHRNLSMSASTSSAMPGVNSHTNHLSGDHGITPQQRQAAESAGRSQAGDADKEHKERDTHEIARKAAATRNLNKGLPVKGE